MILPKNMMMALTSKNCEAEHVNEYGYKIKYPLYEANKLGPAYEQYGDQLICLQCIKEKQDALFAQKISDDAIEKEKNKRKNTMRYASVYSDQSIADAGFKNFEVTAAEEKLIKEKALKSVKHYKAKFKHEADEYFTTMLTGATGVGKSHLAMAILRNLNETLDVECVFVNVRRMLMMIKKSWNDPKYPYDQMYFIDLLSRVDFLVLDDLGNETGSDSEAKQWVKDILTEALEARQTKGTIVTSNYTRDQLTKMYSEDRAVNALISRLLKNTAPIVFKETNDKRVKLFDLDAPIEEVTE